MANQQPIETLFAALADPTRRAVVERLGHGPLSVSDLASRFPMALPSFLKHLKLLESSGLVETAKQGRIRTCTLQPLALDRVESWIIERRRETETRYARLATYLDDLDREISE